MAGRTRTNLRNVLISEAVQNLTSVKTKLVPLQFLYSNASKNVSFSDSFCDTTEDPDNEFSFLSVFQRGRQVLKAQYDSSSASDPLTSGEKLALEKLMKFMDNQYGVCAKLGNPVPRTDIDWTLMVCHHLLQTLAPSEFVVDDRSKYLGNVGELDGMNCPCCNELLIGGRTGDTSIGHHRVWHGQLDVVMGPTAMYTSAESVVTAFDIKGSDKFETVKHQIISETIVFAFWKHKSCPRLKHSLIPLITVSRNHLVVCFYDPVEDYFIQSKPMQLFEHPEPHEPPSEFCFETIVALWLVLHYPLFCSGIPLTMKEGGFKAKFRSTLPKPEIYDIYAKEMHFGRIVEGKTPETSGETGVKRKFIDCN